MFRKFSLKHVDTKQSSAHNVHNVHMGADYASLTINSGKCH